MTAAPHPPDEARRLAALRAYAVLDTPPETAFDDITRLAAHICGTPIALTSLVDEARQWFKARHGLAATETPRDVAFCAHTILDPGAVLVVPDAERDARFADNPLVHTDPPGVRFYAGAPLVTPEGQAIGTLCVIDHVPRDLSADQREALRALGRQVIAQLELRKAVRDIDGLYRDAERVRSTHQAVFDATSDGMMLIAPGGQVLTANRRLLALLDVAEDALVERPLSELTAILEGSVVEADVIMERIRGALAEPAGEFSHVVTTRPPEQRELHLTVRPVRDGQDEYRGHLVVIRDVTHDREVDRMKTEFVSVVSHELRTPLTSVRGYIDLILDGDAGPVTDEQRDYLGVVKQNADRLVGLVNDLLDVSQMESGRVQLDRRPFDLAAAVETVVATLAPALQAKEQELSVAVAAGVRPVLGDRDRIVQVLTNLMSNAHKYTPAGGRIDVHVDERDQAAVIRVTDTGVGIAADDVPKLFRKFYRVNNTLTREVGGTGLGLAIVRSIVAMHGGSISVHSQPGEGATFEVTLPLAAPTEDGAPSVAGSREPRDVETLPGVGARRRILIVDDDRDTLRLLSRTLGKAGFEPLTAPDGPTALALAGENGLSAVLLDLRMAGLDGYAVLERLKQRPETADIPVIAMTGSESSKAAARARALTLGAADLITKPFHLGKLVDVLRTLVREA